MAPPVIVSDVVIARPDSKHPAVAILMRVSSTHITYGVIRNINLTLKGWKVITLDAGTTNAPKNQCNNNNINNNNI